MVRPITSGNKGGGGLEKRIPLLVGLGIGCVIGYLVGLAATPTPTTLSSLLLSPTATTTTVAVVPTAAAAAAVVEKEDGWNNLHVYYGKPNSPHLELLTPMAQAKQDEYVAAMLKNKKQGYFVDLAAHDATYLSNTFKLEQDHDWNGLCIEPNPIYWRRLSYRRCQVVAAVVGQTTNEEIRFHVGNDGAMGGILKAGFDNDPSGGNIDSTKVSAYYTVTLTQVLERMQAPSVIDYLCLDVEGAEFYIMQNFAFDRYAFKILTIERPKAELVALLEQKNYLNLCVISNFGETLWVEKSHMKTLDVSTLPSECRKI